MYIYIRIGMTSKLKEINFNDLPGEIKLKKYNINVGKQTNKDIKNIIKAILVKKKI